MNTFISVVLDRSGSMSSIRDDTIGGFNEFLARQKEVPGECRFTLCQFDHEYEVLCRGVLIQNVEPLTRTSYVPRGQTALLDAIGRTIEATRAAIIAMTEKPSKVIFVIVTDGQENDSREFKRQQVKDMIGVAQANDWQFVYLGADVDAFSEAGRLGSPAAQAMQFGKTPDGVFKAYRAVAQNVAEVRTRGALSAAFTPEQRAEQEEEIKKQITPPTMGAT